MKSILEYTLARAPMQEKYLLIAHIYLWDEVHSIFINTFVTTLIANMYTYSLYRIYTHRI